MTLAAGSRSIGGLAATMDPISVLIVEAEPAVVGPMRRYIEHGGYQIVTAKSGSVALQQLASAHVDLILLSLVLPGTSGLDVLRDIRRRGHGQPLIALASVHDEHGCVAALRAGADDYISRPFSPSELIARVRVRCRAVDPRTRTLPDATALLRVSRPRRRVWSGGTEVLLTPKEFDLLCVLIEAGGCVVPKRELLLRVWHAPPELKTSTLEFHAGSLRRKLAVSGIDGAFRTARKIGYAWELADVELE
jgi:DNA-binding response OmpR family regulator